MNRTIYVRDEDVPTWERARELAGDKLSPVILDGLRRFVATKEAEGKGFERIEVLYQDAAENGLPKAKAFFGRWIFPRDKPYRLETDGAFGSSQDCTAVAVTAKGRIVILQWHEYEGEPSAQFFKVYDTLNEAMAENVNPRIIAAIMEQLGVAVEELDI